MSTKVRVGGRRRSATTQWKRIIVLFAVAMLWASMALAMAQPASAVSTTVDGVTAEPTVSGTSATVDPASAASGEAVVAPEGTSEALLQEGTPSPAAEEPAVDATETPAISAGEDSGTPTIPPTLVRPHGLGEGDGIVGPQAVVEPLASSGQATITIDAAAVRGSNTGLAGTTYTLHDVQGAGNNANPYRPGPASSFSCTIAQNANSCTITVTGVSAQGGNGKNWFVVQTPNAAAFGVPQYRLNDYSNPQDIFYYVGRTVSLQSGRDYAIPGTTSNSGLDQKNGNQTRASSVVLPLKNPPLSPTCQPGLKVAIQMDVSSSTADYRTQYRNALHGLVDGLVGTGTQISLFTFGNSSPVSVGSSSWESPAPRNVDTAASAIKANITTYTGNPGTQRTNWDGGFRRLAAAHAIYDFDLIVFITDGAPNVVWSSSGYTSPNGNNVTVRSIDEAVLSANALKAAGVRTVTVGVGDGVKGEVYRNLQAISGPTSGSDYYVGDWAELQGYIKNIVDAANCSLPITVSKTTVDKSGTGSENVSGWRFSAAKATGSDGAVQVTGASSQTTGSGLNGRALWNLRFTQPSGQSASVKLTEADLPAGWSFSDAQCTVDANPVAAVVDPSDRSVTVSNLTAASGAVHCTFTNTETPPKATLTLVKRVDNRHGGTGAIADWTLSATGETAGVDGITGDAGVTNKTVAPGKYTLSESGPGGYDASAWKCVDTKTGRDIAVVKSSVDLADGDSAVCTITNSDKPGSATWKKVDEDGTALAGSQWTLVGPGHEGGTAISDCTVASCSGPDKDPAGGQLKLEGLSWGHYTVTESAAPAGYRLDDSALSFEFDIGAEALDFVNPEAIVNNRVLGAVTWSKVASGSDEPLGGSEWELRGPDGTPKQTIVDNVGQAGYLGSDTDPATGKFKLEDLAWGEYSLAESKAPAGYRLLEEPISFAVGPEDPAQLVWELGAIDNVQRDGVDLPLTGGRSTDAILAGGGVLLLGAAAAGVVHRRRRA
ncbi:SpaA isopeptide-forming pilin-related protein [Actinomycetaceae bacterium L2_0104]